MGLAADSPPRVVGLLPEGMTEAVARTVAAQVRDAFLKEDGSIVRALRIIPSSLATLAPDIVQFVANATVEPKPARSGAPAGRSKVIDSVVTVNLAQGAVSKVRIPFLEHEIA